MLRYNGIAIDLYKLIIPPKDTYVLTSITQYYIYSIHVNIFNVHTIQTFNNGLYMSP